jgi:hypothetical protein
MLSVVILIVIMLSVVVLSVVVLNVVMLNVVAPFKSASVPELNYHNEKALFSVRNRQPAF